VRATSADSSTGAPTVDSLGPHVSSILDLALPEFEWRIYPKDNARSKQDRSARCQAGEILDEGLGRSKETLLEAIDKVGNVAATARNEIKRKEMAMALKPDDFL
jgi:hypothetical protein